MRYSPNLNIIIKALEKASNHVARDFVELENLQSNSVSANKFASSCYSRVKKIIFNDFSNLRPDYNIIFSDGEKIVRRQDAEYSYIVFPVDGLDNLARSNPDFTVAIALEHSTKDGKKEVIALAINKIVGNEMYYCEKGFGAYVNNRRIRVSKRSANETVLIASESLEFLRDEVAIKKFSPRAYGCGTLGIAYLAAAKLEVTILKNGVDHEFLKSFLLLVKEAGGKISERNGFVIASNGVV